MKRFINILIVIMLLICTTGDLTFASQNPINTNIVVQGIYKVGENNANFVPGKYKVELISSNSIVYVYIIDNNNIQRYSKRFDSKDSGKPYPFSVGTLKEGDSIIIFGKGELYLNNILN
ncbi:hypothetical protein [Clostridium uliginosum]|uniref:Uncharacterized protein n=1 Tax=Clostridium uliginosum TaxID=119641 RepID=A0A1I1L3P1_9CLOT|nr:hypothetical protein [Clostridium uliginosum]SFC67565.1 hypothetical protein SAMN05421842_10755 [Clostridium uliginosum]